MVNKKLIRRRQRRFHLHLFVHARNGLVFGFEIEYSNPLIRSYQCPAIYFKERAKRKISLCQAPSNIITDDYKDTLVDLGYYYSAKKEICCYSCGFKLTECDVFKDPLVDHLYRHPDCEHLKQHGQTIGHPHLREELLQGLTLNDDNRSTATETSGPSEGSAFSGKVCMPQYKTERARLASFTNFESTSGVTPASLAEAGFFYTGVGDAVRCFSCGIGFKEWSPGDMPGKEHFFHSPKCQYRLYIKGMVNTLAINPSDGSAFSGKVCMPQYKTERARLASFTNFESTSGVTPASLAEAGFFYTGVSDNVRCFSCGVGLKDWCPYNLPLKEHDTYSPKCQYLLYMEGGNASFKGHKHYSSMNTMHIGNGKTTTEQQLKETEKERFYLCKICLDFPACIVYLPCGHLACAECAPTMRTCPICRQLVKGTVKAYMS